MEQESDCLINRSSKLERRGYVLPLLQSILTLTDRVIE